MKCLHFIFFICLIGIHSCQSSKDQDESISKVDSVGIIAKYLNKDSFTKVVLAPRKRYFDNSLAFTYLKGAKNDSILFRRMIEHIDEIKSGQKLNNLCIFEYDSLFYLKNKGKNLTNRYVSFDTANYINELNKLALFFKKSNIGTRLIPKIDTKDMALKFTDDKEPLFLKKHDPFAFAALNGKVSYKNGEFIVLIIPSSIGIPISDEGHLLSFNKKGELKDCIFIPECTNCINDNSAMFFSNLQQFRLKYCSDRYVNTNNEEIEKREVFEATYWVALDSEGHFFVTKKNIKKFIEKI